METFGSRMNSLFATASILIILELSNQNKQYWSI